MSYPRSMLNDGEEIVLDRHPHWSFMLGAVFMDLGALLVAIVLLIIGNRWLLIFGLLVMLFALIGTLGRYLRWKTIEFVITTDRIIVRSGILSKQGLEIPLERVMNIAYHQALWERILGTGDLVIESAGENGHQPFSDVQDPSGVQNLLYRQMEIASNGPQPRGEQHDGLSNAGMHGGKHVDQKQKPSESIPEQISKLGELRDRGILSDEEFEKKKKQLLDRM